MTELSGTALDRAIAEALGWRFEIVNGDPNWMYVFDPTGKKWGYFDEDYSGWYERVHVDRLYTAIPTPSDDANVSIDICLKLNWAARFEDGDYWVITYDGHKYYGWGKTPQESIARAILKALISEKTLYNGSEDSCQVNE